MARQPAAGPHRPRHSSRCVRRRGFQPAGSLVRSAASPIRRVRPNQAMQRTGGVRGFTVLPPGPGRRWGRPAADCFFVRPHQPGGWQVALTLLVGLHAAAGPRRPRRSSRCGVRRGFQPACSLVQSAASPVRRVRPNQAMQRTGGVCGFTVLPPDLGRRCGRRAADCFFVRPHPKRPVLFRASVRRQSADRRAFQPVGVTVRGSLVSCGSAACGSSRVLAACLAAFFVAARAASLTRSAASHARRVRPNQALQRTGNVCGFTLLSRFQPVVGLAGR